MSIETAKDIIPLQEFQERAPDIIKRMEQSSSPLVLTVEGHASAVVMTASQYDRLTTRERYLESIASGLDDIEKGKEISHEDMIEEIQKWWDESARP